MFKLRFWQGFAFGVVATLIVEFILKVWKEAFS